MELIVIGWRKEIWARDLGVISIWVPESMDINHICPLRREGCLGKNPDGRQNWEMDGGGNACKGESEGVAREKEVNPQGVVLRSQHIVSWRTGGRLNSASAAWWKKNVTEERLKGVHWVYQERGHCRSSLESCHWNGWERVPGGEPCPSNFL